jgi:Bifunctional DNA primase/polymerase, N-terminal/Primase C terminal 1 (PriCT-1)
MSGIFSRWQPIYAERGIATFPVDETKKPHIKGWQKVGLKGSAELAAKFTNAEALGFECGPRNRVTKLDVDSRNEKLLADALSTYGHTPLIARTPSGGFHAWYRHNGESRQIKPVPHIDIIGRGNAVAPPSRVAKGAYEFVQGSLDDLERLPQMRLTAGPQPRVRQGERNQALFDHCHRHARHCDDFDAVLDVARTFNMECEPPMSNAEVFKTVRSVWKWRQNKRGQHGTFVSVDEVDNLLDKAGPDALALWTFLRGHNGPNSIFMVTNTLTETFGWGLRRMQIARFKLIELNELLPVRQAGEGFPALYRWAK